MIVFSQLPLQTAIYDTLAGDTNLMALVEAIYDRPPQGSAFPYISIGDSSARDWSTPATSGTEQMFTLHVWSREGGRAQTATIMERVYQLLHQADMEIAGHTLALMQLVSTSLALESDGDTYHGILKFRALLLVDL